jgi:hypothetical protein
MKKMLSIVWLAGICAVTIGISHAAGSASRGRARLDSFGSDTTSGFSSIESAVGSGDSAQDSEEEDIEYPRRRAVSSFEKDLKEGRAEWIAPWGGDSHGCGFVLFTSKSVTVCGERSSTEDLCRIRIEIDALDENIGAALLDIDPRFIGRGIQTTIKTPLGDSFWISDSVFADRVNESVEGNDRMHDTIVRLAQLERDIGVEQRTLKEELKARQMDALRPRSEKTTASASAFPSSSVGNEPRMFQGFSLQKKPRPPKARLLKAPVARADAPAKRRRLLA